MQDLVKDWPVWGVFIFMFCLAMARGNATYWIGRAIRAGGARSRFAGRLDRPGMVRAENLVRRFGPFAVAFGFLTVGVQTAINLTAGIMRMPQSRWLPAVALGALMWATLYTTVGLAFVGVLLGRIEWWWAVIALGVVAVVVLGSKRLSDHRKGSLEPR